MKTRSTWIWAWTIGAVLASSAFAQVKTTIIDNLPTCIGNRNGQIIAVGDAVDEADCSVGGATGLDRVVHGCICDTFNTLGPYWKALGGAVSVDLGDYALSADLASYVPVTKAGQQTIAATGAGNDITTTAVDDTTFTTGDRITLNGGTDIKLNIATGEGIILEGGGMGEDGEVNLQTAGIFTIKNTGAGKSLIVASGGTIAFVAYSPSGAAVSVTDSTSSLLSPDATNSVAVANARTTITGGLGLASQGTAPTAATDACTTGQVIFSSTYVYFCHNTNTWVRAALATWP